MKILLDTNVWRYLFDSGQHERLHQIARRSRVQIVIAPLIIVETLRLSDRVLRKNIIELQTRDCWKRLMPESYLECSDLREEIFKFHPDWVREKRDTVRYRNLRYDWVRSNGGWWSKVRTETEAVAAHYFSQDTNVLEETRQQARDTRHAVHKRGEVILGRRSLTEIPGSWTTRTGEEVKMDGWRVYGHLIWGNMLRQNSPFRDWLGCDVDVNLLLTLYAAEFAHFWAYEVQASSLPRMWIRTAMTALQSERTTTDGTPADAALAVHLVDVDWIVSADKNFVFMANRIYKEAPVDLGNAFLIRSGREGIEQLFQFISDPNNC